MTSHGLKPLIGILHSAICILIFAITAPVGAQEDAPQNLAVREEAALQAAAERVADSVVQIRTIGGLDVVGRTLLADGPTTGLVISADGYIVSSAFNFVQQPASILVTFKSGKQAPAELVATDHSRMLVLLKATGVADLTVPELAPADEIRVGQWAIAVGRTFRPDRTNVSVGIVSAVGRMFGKVLQTDAGVSTANYGGPLVDIRGRVLGVLVPMAPQATSEVAGVEWYDSGIGFAVPLASIADRIKQMKKGDDLHAGILGIGLVPKNPHAAPAELAAVRPDSPAGKEGLKKGDRIIELNGKPVRTQTDLRFALGTLYGGDRVELVARRGEERIERTIELVGELDAYRHAFLGILPLRPASQPSADDDDAKEADDDDDDESSQPAAKTATAEEDNGESQDAADDDAKPSGGDDENRPDRGIGVRMAYSGSPADKAGVRPGDRVVQINSAEVDSIGDALAELNNAAPGSEVELRLIRDGKPLDLKLTASRLPTHVPSELPPAYVEAGGSSAVLSASPTAEPPAAAGGETIDLKLPEFPQNCRVYVPASEERNRPLGLLMWLHAPGEVDTEQMIRQWQPVCDRYGLLLVVPLAAEANRWERTELEYLGRLIERVLSEHTIDPRRVVVAGQGGGGSMAWLLGLAGRHVIHGVATSAAPLPRQIKVPPNEPTQRLAVFAAVPSDKNAAVQIAMGLQKLSEAGYPVTAQATADEDGQLSAANREELGRWIDTLDRF